MNIGSLYKVKKYFWFLFPTKETALDAVHALHLDAAAYAVHSAAVGESEAAWYSKQLNCDVSYFCLDSIVVFLEEDGKLKKVLTSDGKIGWTWFTESCNDYFEEVKTQ
jgi:hypothetical protein